MFEPQCGVEVGKTSIGPYEVKVEKCQAKYRISTRDSDWSPIIHQISWYSSPGYYPDVVFAASAPFQRLTRLSGDLNASRHMPLRRGIEVLHPL